MSDFERLRKLRDSAAIAGIGETPFSRNSGKTSEELYVRVALDAISDAGLVPGDIDGLMMPSYTALPPGLLETFLNITPNYTGLVDVGGASAGSLVLNAALLVSSGVATNVLCITARNDSSGRGGRRRSGANARQTVSGYSSLTVPYGWINPPSMYAMMARRHMHKYGGPTTTQLGWVAVTMRKHASLNEHAQMRTPISLEKHAASRMIAEPFRLLDCCLISDGGAAVVVTTAERARDCPKPPVLLSGFAQGRPSSPADLVNRPAMEELGLERAAPTALTMAGITVSEIDFAEIYDCFTYVVIKQLEILGFCKAGEGGSFVENGRIGLDGELPVNTHGGLLSQGHMSGMNHIVEAVRQLRREAGPSQVPKARTGLVTGYGDLGDASVLVLRSAA
jgi:acetyl-CoA acetyltransferase